MSIFGKILAKIFPSNHPAVVQPNSPSSTSATAASTPPGNTPSPAAPATPATPAPSTAVTQVDVESVLAGLSAKNPGPANWRTSIVDLLKLLDLDSDLNSRKELANELHYSGDTSDSATMNTWLHKQVMAKLAANGGKVPADLQH
jgi:hypothetical protein